MDFAKIKDAIADFAELIKGFVQMIANFVDSWKKHVEFEAP